MAVSGGHPRSRRRLLRRVCAAPAAFVFLVMSMLALLLEFGNAPWAAAWCCSPPSYCTYYNSQYGNHFICDDNRTEYINYGGPTSVLGPPSSNQAATTCGGGQYFFTQEALPGYHAGVWGSPGTGAHEVHGLISNDWAALGYECSVIGFPTGDDAATGRAGPGVWQPYCGCYHDGIWYSGATGPMRYTA